LLIDVGTSALYSGERRGKDELIFSALGSIDELSAQLGLAFVHCNNDGNELPETITEIQSRLFDIMSHIATPAESASESKIVKTSFPDHETGSLEAKIDELDAKLPKLTKFILPSGGLASAQLHVCRAVCRRAERQIVALWQGALDEHKSVLTYMNRLSDFLFVAARTASFFVKSEEMTYKKGKGIEINQ